MVLQLMHSAVRHQTIIPGVDAISITSDRTFPRHSHDEFGFGYLVMGGQDSWSGRGLVEAQPGDTITVNPAELHDGIGRRGHPRQWRMVFISPSALAKLSDVPVNGAEFSLPVNGSKRALELTAQAFDALTTDQPDRDHSEQTVMLGLAAQLNLDCDGDHARISQHSKAVQIVLDIICQDWAAPLSLADFAAVAEVSKFQLLRRFSQEMGATPHAYLMQHRVKRAKEMITAGSPLADAAVACGFSDQSHLTRTFSRQLGLTPGSFAQPAIR